jgi:phage-related protein
MADIDWLTSIPVALVGTIREGRVANYVNDARAVGAARRRARFTRTLKTFGFSLRLTNAEAALLRTFIDTTTGGGVEAFNWTHPVTAVEYEMRFAELPEFSDYTKGVWNVSVSLEEI